MISIRTSIPVTSVAVAAVLASSVRAAVPVPAGLNPGDKYNLVFVSLTTGTALSQDINAYDTIVSGDASAHGLNVDSAGNPVAWEVLATVGDGLAVTSAKSRFNPGSPIYTLDGTKIADGGSSLWDGTLDAPLDIGPDGSTVVSEAWTGTGMDGNVATGPGGFKALGNTASVTNPLGPGTLGPAAAVGNTVVVDQNWIDTTLDDSTVVHPYYAFSSELTVPAPEPASVGLLGLGLAALGMRGKRR